MYNGRVNIISDNLNNQSIPLFSENNDNINLSGDSLEEYKHWKKIKDR